MGSRTGRVEIPERTASLAGLRCGAFDVAVGVSPRRARVDAVEVVLVATLGAGKEAYLRTGACPARTIGRAAGTAGERRGQANGLRMERT